ncbi:MAG: hypothetical protein ABID45_03900 [Patescibacteria group bacterium]
MKEIIIPKPNNDSFLAQLKSLYSALEGVSSDDSVNFNFSKLKWMYPLLILPLSAHINSTKNAIHKIDNKDIEAYLNIVKFPKGIDTITRFEHEQQKRKNYIPISVINRIKKESNDLENMFLEMVSKYIGTNPGMKNAVFYPITELVGNIFEHSKQNKGFLFGQYYPRKKYLDICIVDCGRGLAGAYKEEKKLHFSDKKAIKQAMKGNSTKPYKDRGYGLHTSRDIICRVINGDFIMISGSAALISSSKREILVNLPRFHWQGTIIAFRIPKTTKAIDIYPYLE